MQPNNATRDKPLITCPQCGGPFARRVAKDSYKVRKYSHGNQSPFGFKVAQGFNAAYQLECTKCKASRIYLNLYDSITISDAVETQAPDNVHEKTTTTIDSVDKHNNP